MAILDFLKNKEEETSKPVQKKPAKASVAKKEVTAKVSDEKKTGKINNSGFSYEAVKQPHISEKASYLAESNQYIFDVLPGYNKNEIANSVEGIYKVNVLSVNIVKIPAKKRRLGRTQGFRKAYKKAIVTIKEGQKIEIL